MSIQSINFLSALENAAEKAQVEHTQKKQAVNQQIQGLIDGIKKDILEKQGTISLTGVYDIKVFSNDNKDAHYKQPLDNCEYFYNHDKDSQQFIRDHFNLVVQEIKREFSPHADEEVTTRHGSGCKGHRFTMINCTRYCNFDENGNIKFGDPYKQHNSDHFLNMVEEGYLRKTTKKTEEFANAFVNVFKDSIMPTIAKNYHASSQIVRLHFNCGYSEYSRFTNKFEIGITHTETFSGKYDMRELGAIIQNVKSVFNGMMINCQYLDSYVSNHGHRGKKLSPTASGSQSDIVPTAVDIIIPQKGVDSSQIAPKKPETKSGWGKG